MSYLELLKLAAPEAIVAVTALAVLAIGLIRSGESPSNRRSSAFCSAVAVLGLAAAVGAVLMLPQSATLFGGMLVILVTVSLLGESVLDRYSGAMERTFNEEFQSVAACEDMNSAVDHIDTALQEHFWRNSPIDRAELDRRGHRSRAEEDERSR